MISCQSFATSCSLKYFVVLWKLFTILPLFKDSNRTKAAEVLRSSCSSLLVLFILRYEGESNEKLKIVIKIQNTARLSCKLTTMILMV